MTAAGSQFTVSIEAVDTEDSVALLRVYFAEMTSRYIGREATEDEVDASQAEDPNTDLVAPTGRFLVAREGGRPVGCIGLRLLDERTAELTRMFVLEESRGRGAGKRLLAAVERTASELGMRAMRLDTRSDLVEARKLYSSNGYVEIEPYSDALYADHWLEKRLAPRAVEPGHRG